MKVRVFNYRTSAKFETEFLTALRLIYEPDPDLPSVLLDAFAFDFRGKAPVAVGIWTPTNGVDPTRSELGVITLRDPDSTRLTEGRLIFSVRLQRYGAPDPRWDFWRPKRHQR